MARVSLPIGTCSWKYDSWRGLIYPQASELNYLREYSLFFNTVEVDQWFWSLFKKNQVVLPKPDVVSGYAASVDEGFRFGIKVPNSVTLTHRYRNEKSDPLEPNPYFLSTELMQDFLYLLAPLGPRIGPLILQFEYLNKQKMSGVSELLDRLASFVEQLPSGLDLYIELRNPYYLTGSYFDFLKTRGIGHVFLQGYYMPPIFKIFTQHRRRLGAKCVIRLLGPERQEIEKLTNEKWDSIVIDRHDELQQLAAIIGALESDGVRWTMFINNHFEGSAPRTINRLLPLLGNPPLFP